MIDKLPIDIVRDIIDELFNNYHPIEMIKYRNVNQTFRSLIDNKKLDKSIIKENDNIKKETDIYLRKNTNIRQIEWLFDNHVNLNLDHIRTIIIYNRIDIIQKGFYYKNFLKLIFNRFYLDEQNTNNLYATIECKNPLIIASKYNRVNIVKLLVESCTVGNPYTKVLNGILDIAVTHGHKDLFCYLVTYHYNSISQLMNSKINKIIHRFDNCEDIFFYMIVNDKIVYDWKILLGCISKKYHELFLYIYPKLKITNRLELLNKTIHMNDIKLFNYVLNDYRIANEYFTDIVTINNLNHKFTKDFLYNILNNHINRITKTSSIIHLCLENNISDDFIIKLINDGFNYDDDEMLFALKNKKIVLLKEMCNFYSFK
jgi:hypothetical protein